MSKLIAKLEKKFGRFAISNLSLYMVILYGVGVLLSYVYPTLLDYFSLSVYYILRGQVWRLVTWIIIPEYHSNIFLAVISLLCFYMLGRNLERAWGTFLFNFFVFMGSVFIVLGQFIAVGISGLLTLASVLPAEYFYLMYVIGQGGTYYIYMSLFLAFAITFPDARVLLMYIFPIRAKYIGIVYVILLGIEVLSVFSASVPHGFVFLTQVFFSLLNVIAFFAWTRRGRMKSPKEIKRQHEYRVKMRKATVVNRHKCAICGRTAEEYPQLQFRYCSKCEGNYEYCSEHLFTHEHVKK